MKHDTDLTGKKAFMVIGKNIALLRGATKNSDLIRFKGWILSLRNDCIQDGILLIDSEGGATDPSIIAEIMQIPLHTHVLNTAYSFAGLVALAGSTRTATLDATFMFHAAKWKETKEADSVARDEEVLFKHKYRMLSMATSILPRGEALETIAGAMMEEEADTYVKAGWMYETYVLDGLYHIPGKDLPVCEDTKLWYDRTYRIIKED